MLNKDELIDYKNQLTDYILKTYFNEEENFVNFCNIKSVLSTLIEISSVSNRYCQNLDNKLKKILIKHCIVLLFQLECCIRYAEIKLDTESVDLTQPTIYTPFLVSNEEIDVIDTLGKMTCNLSMGLWNDFENRNYSIISMINRFKASKEDKSFLKFLLEILLYLASLISRQDPDYINNILITAFFVKPNNRIDTLLEKLKKQPKVEIPEPILSKPKVEQPLDIVEPIDEALEEARPVEELKMTVIGQPPVLDIAEPENEAIENEYMDADEIKAIQDGVKEHGEEYEKFISDIDEGKEPDNIFENLETEAEQEEIIIRESHISEDGELEESNIKTTIIDEE